MALYECPLWSVLYPMSKVTTMASAISDAVNDGDSLYLAGFTHLIPFAAGHEIIRAGYSDLELVRATPDLVYDQLIAAGCVSKVTFSWAGNPGVGSLRAFRRAVEAGVPNPIETEEYTHYGMVAALHAGAANLPFMPVRTFAGSDLVDHNDAIRTVSSPYGDDEIPVVPPIEPDVAIVSAQRGDEDGNAHLWGIPGEQKEAALAADTVVCCVEELCSTETIRSDPNRTLFTADAVDHVVEVPYGAHPSYAQGYYDRDNEAYLEWEEVSKSHEDVQAWLDEWVYGVENRREYLEKLGAKRLLDLEVDSRYATAIDMGDY
ncbi:CoA transferase subunit A [Natrinema marinum]|uniref:CoA transferase subunit A n=1 Tax=Natrinema marinum TaxID=2961598 RepID=UPI0020C8F8AF|nr:CoA-transferase [Natrinema marinum]